MRHLSVRRVAFLFHIKRKDMDTNDIIQPMTGKKVYYNIGHDDLVDFANLIIKKTKEEDSRLRKEEAASEFYTRAEVKDLLHVCDSTLTKWAARKYLVPVRVGGKTMFRKTDVRKILDKR